MNVMLISRPTYCGQYEAIRTGSGIIHQDAWDAAGAATEFVKLI
jgi:hypothetical protein